MKGIRTSFKIIFFVILFISIVGASELNYNKEQYPLFDYNNSSLIESVWGAYSIDGESYCEGLIGYMKDDNVSFHYYLEGDETTSSKIDCLGINNPELTFNKTAILFNLNYSTTDNVKYIIPFSFYLGQWPETVHFGIKQELNDVEKGPIAITGGGKALIFPLLPESYFYKVDWADNSCRIYVVANPSPRKDSLKMELHFIPLNQVDELFAIKDSFLYHNPLKMFPSPIQTFTFTDNDNNESITTDFHNLTTDDLSRWNFESSSSIVINGELMEGATPSNLNQYLNNINVALESISFEDASKLNQSEWIYDGNQYFKIYEANVEKVTIDYSLDGMFHYILVTQSQIVPTIVIDCKDQEINQLSFNYNQSGIRENETISINNDNEIIFSKPLSFKGSSFYFPFDSYHADIYAINPPFLKEKTSELPFVDGSRFEGNAHFSRDNIEFEMTSRKDLKIQFWITLVFFVISLLLLFMENDTNSNWKKGLGVFGAFLSFTIGNLAFLLSIGTIFFVIILFISVIFQKHYSS